MLEFVRLDLTTRTENGVFETLTLIVEPNSSGHRLYYVSLLVKALQSAGNKSIVLTTAAAMESDNWLTHLGHLEPEVIEQSANEFTLHDIASVSATLGAKDTIVPNADHYLTTVVRRGWSGPSKLKLFVMRAEGQAGPPLSWMRPAKTVLKRILIWLAGLRPCVRVFALHSPLQRLRGPLHWVADPVTLEGTSDQRREMREYLESHGDRYWIGVFGAISPRKNLPTVVAAILDQPDIGLLIAGSVDPLVSDSVAPLLDKFTANGGRVIQLLGSLSDAEFDSAIGAVDCVVAAYSTEGSSGVVLKAAASGKRLVLAGAKSFRRYAARLGDQATWCPLEVGAISRAIYCARQLPDPGVRAELGATEFVNALTS